MNSVLIMIVLVMITVLGVLWNSTSATRHAKVSKEEGHKWYHYRMQKTDEHHNSALCWIVISIIVGAIGVLFAWLFV